ncbi:hypothetical protein N619_00020, partial [Ectopseudomonas oleovorans]
HTTSKQLYTLLIFISYFQILAMSSTCGNCDCADKSQCVKKGSSYGIDIVETGKSYVETIVMDAPAAEHDGKCKCGPSCSCTSCTCGQ